MSLNPSRRGFIKSTAAVVPAVIGAGCSSKTANSGQKSAPLKIGLMTYNLAKNWDIETIIKNCTEAKYEHVELRTTHAHGVEVTLSKAERQEVRKRFEDAGLKLSLASAFRYHYPDQKLVRENIEGTKEYTLLAHDIGALGIRVFPNEVLVDQGIPEEKTFEQIGKAVGECAEFAKDYGVQIRLAVHGKGTDFVPKVKKMIDYSGSDHVYVNWNCSPNDVTGEGFEANFNMVKDRIGNVHIHELWDETYPYRKFFELMKQNGYQGYLDAEIPESPEPVRLMKYYRALFLAYQDAI